ncbi:hypothetical protein AAE02nite_27590 [Adhaeribacter aerolatus]|uniref:STAS/SEC14 domain-containing protein n=1 Tax=Adhaeribacter aerolatus TaxID=670289 RepID=A0A512AZE9_9BACT|nr:STAS/SEC14 domain-containing protein [Adhaeribacter aerolatus]GEO05095.1 hypothetical protein AAE02nite_27590 [Adhaeribacter aerolatus]
MQTNYVDRQLGALVAIFDDFMKPEEFKRRCNKTLELVKETGITKALIDTRDLKVMVQENQRWIDDVWYPEAKRVGLRHMAFIIPEDFFGKLSVETANRRVVREGVIQVHYFDEEEAARNWLKLIRPD